MVKPIKWTIEMLSKLTDEKVLTVRENAIREKSQETVEMCDAVMATRKVHKPAANLTRRRRGSGISSVATEVAIEMGQFARELSLRLDLSKETARRKAGRVKSFVYHEIVDSIGNAKLGGAEKTKIVQVDRYLSYRLGDDTVSVSAFLLLGEDKNQLHYEVQAPPALLPEGVPLRETARKSLYVPTAGTERYLFKEFSTLAEALGTYERLLRKLQEIRGIPPLTQSAVSQ